MNQKRDQKIIIVFFLLVLVIIVWLNLAFPLGRPAQIFFLDVGQGDATLVVASSGRSLLVDGGPNQKVIAELSKTLSFWQDEISVVAITHPDLDHIGGLIPVLRKYKVDLVIETGETASTSAYLELEKLIEAKKIKKVLVKRGDMIDLGGLKVAVLFPDRVVHNWTENDSSLVLKISNGGKVAILTGDSPKNVLDYLAEIDCPGLKSEIVKVGHHGSRTSNSEYFLGCAQSQFAIISAGEKNRYGHPHQEVLDSLQKFGDSILETFKEGRIGFEWGEGGLVRI